MFFAVAQVAVGFLQMSKAQERAQVDEEFRQQMLAISAEQERVNAEAQVAGRLAEYNEVMAAQDVIFGTQGRLEEGSARAIERESERALGRDVSLIRAAGATREKMARAGAAGEASAFAKSQAAERAQFLASSIETIGTAAVDSKAKKVTKKQVR